MRAPFSFVKRAGGGGGSPAVVSAISFNLGDTTGGGQPVVITVDNSAGATGAALGGSGLTSFTIVDGTHVRGVPSAHLTPGVVDVVVTNGAGASTGGTGLFEYWGPGQISGVAAVLDSSQQTFGGASVNDWRDITINALDFVQATGGNKPTLTSNDFGTMPGLDFAGGQWLERAGTFHFGSSAKCYFAVVASTDTTAHGGGAPGDPSTGRPGSVILGDGTGDYFSFGLSAGKMGYQQYDSMGAVTHYTEHGSGLNDGVPRLLGVIVGTTPSSNETFYVGATPVASFVPANPDDIVQGIHTIGSTFNRFTPFTGKIGAVVAVDGSISAGAGSDLDKLNRWAQQRFGTPIDSPPDPSTIANLDAWFRADSNVTSASSLISAIGDKSSAGVEPTLTSSGAARPTFLASGINGLPDIQWAASNGLIGTNALLGTTAITLFAIFKTTDASPMIVWGMHYGDYHYALTLNAGVAQFEIQDDAFSTFGGSGLNDGNPHVLVGTWGTGDNTARLYIDGILAANTGSRASAITNAGSDANSWGSGNWTAAPPYYRPFVGQSPEVGAFNAVLSSGNRTLLTAYLKSRAGIG